MRARCSCGVGTRYLARVNVSSRYSKWPVFSRPLMAEFWVSTEGVTRASTEGIIPQLRAVLLAGPMDANRFLHILTPLSPPV